uniref:Uncharacterized protein n=1 Tax=Rhizophora mucronata TaxID=61149 RepID=A0A2P2K2X5_RHIMU
MFVQGHFGMHLRMCECPASTSQYIRCSLLNVLCCHFSVVVSYFYQILVCLWMMRRHMRNTIEKKSPMLLTKR